MATGRLTMPATPISGLHPYQVSSARRTENNEQQVQSGNADSDTRGGGLLPRQKKELRNTAGNPNSDVCANLEYSIFFKLAL